MSKKEILELTPEQVEAMDVRIYDNGGKTQDRYTAVYMDRPEIKKGLYASVGMDENPFSPQGFGQHGVATPGSHLGKRIEFSELPPACQKLVKQDLTEQTQEMNEEAKSFKISSARAAAATAAIEQATGHSAKNPSKKIKI